MKKIAVDSFLQFKFVSNPGFSPDGKYVAFIVSYANKASNDYKADIHLLETETGKVRQLTNGGDAKAYCLPRPDAPRSKSSWRRARTSPPFMRSRPKAVRRCMPSICRCALAA